MKEIVELLKAALVERGGEFMMGSDEVEALYCDTRPDGKVELRLDNGQTYLFTVERAPDWDREPKTCFVAHVSEMEAKRRKLEAVFDRVRNPADWRAPISAVCQPHEKDLVREAIVFFTATEPTFSEFPGTGFLKVTALGYRQGPAGDH